MARVERTKCLHFKLEKETHLAFKMKLTQENVSMQEAFEAFAEAIGEGRVSALALIERHKRARVKASLAEVGLRPLTGIKARPIVIRELDAETLYGLIDEDDDDENPPVPVAG